MGSIRINNGKFKITVGWRCSDRLPLHQLPLIHDWGMEIEPDQSSPPQAATIADRASALKGINLKSRCFAGDMRQEG